MSLLSKPIIRDTISLYVSHGANFLVPLLLIPYLSRKLGPDGWGNIVFALSMAQYLSLIVEYAFHLSGQRQVARVSSSVEAVSEVYSRVMSAKFVLAAILSPIAMTLSCAMRLAPLLLTVMAIAYAISQAFTYAWILRGLSMTFVSSIIDLVTKVIGAICIVLAVNSRDDAWLYLLCLSVSGFAGIALSYILVKKKYNLKLSLSGGISEIRESWAVFRLHAVGTVISLLPVTMLGLYRSPTDVAFYAAADKIARTVSSLTDPIRYVMFPRLSHLFANNSDAAKGEIRTTLILMTLLGSVLSLLVLALSGVIIKAIFGNMFLASVPILWVLSALPILLAVGNVFVVLGLLPMGRERLLVKLLAVEFVFMAIAGSYFVPRFGCIGLSILAVVSEFLVVGVASHFYFRDRSEATISLKADALKRNDQS